MKFHPVTVIGALLTAVCIVPRGPAPAAQGGAPDPGRPSLRTVEFLSDTYHVDRKYPSMLGPQSSQIVRLTDSETDELLWITGFRAVMVGEDGVSPMSQEFMCHSNLDMNMRLHRRLLGLERGAPDRVFTLSQGQQELVFPEGFGLPVLASEAFKLTTQVLNLNEEGNEFRVRHKVAIDFIPDAETTMPMKPLFQVVANGLVLIDGADPYYDINEADPNIHGSGCLVGASAVSADHLLSDGQGRRFSGHWVVEPGRQVNHTNVTRIMNLPFDTTVHYIAVHLHPFAESLELRDLTADRVVYRSEASATPGRIGLARVDYFSSTEGVPLFRGHEYELTSVYQNTSDAPQDSMAVMYLYTLDREFRRPAP